MSRSTNIFLRCRSKISDAFSTVGIASAMQGLVIGPYLIVQREMSRNPRLSGEKFIVHSTIMAFFFCLSLTFFIMALVKYRVASKEKTISEHKSIFFLTKVLIFVVGACLGVELCYMIYRTIPLIAWMLQDTFKDSIF